LDVEGRGSDELWRRSFHGFDARSIAKAPRNRKYILGEYDRSMRVLLLIVGIVLVLGGLVWIAQGLNLPFAPRSFMTADRSWIVFGAIAVLVGGTVVWRAAGRRT
jgi:hypothetical protein